MSGINANGIETRQFARDARNKGGYGGRIKFIFDPTLFYGYVFFDMQQSYGLNISWRFGKLNAFVKKTNRTIKNDDLMTGEKGQGKK